MPGKPVVAVDVVTTVVAAAALKFCSLPESFPVFQWFLLTSTETRMPAGEVSDELARIWRVMEPDFIGAMGAELALAVDAIQKLQHS